VKIEKLRHSIDFMLLKNPIFGSVLRIFNPKKAELIDSAGFNFYYSIFNSVSTSTIGG
jgi:hypothetical protein